MTKHNDIVIYKSGDGELSFNVNVFEETIWLTQKQMAELFGVKVPAVNKHLRNIFSSGELVEESVISILEITAADGKTYDTRVYNLDVVICVGYRINSERATQFRIWATKILKQYLVNGYAVNENKIKQIQSSIDELVSSQKILRRDVDRIESLLVKLIEKPIVIHSHNHVSILSDELEKKLLHLLDKIDRKYENKALSDLISNVKKDVVEKDKKSKNRVIKFLKKLGDEKSDIRKVVKGAGVAKGLIDEVIKVGDKLRNLF